MNIKRKKKKVFLAAYLVGFFLAAGLALTIGTQKTFAAADDALCKSYNTNFGCMDTTKLSATVGCQRNKCLGRFTDNANVQCCPIDSPLKSETTPVVATPTTTSVAGSTTFTNPLEYKNVEELLGGLMSAIQKIIVVLALVFIMIGSVMILTSAGNSGMVEKGKGAITMALIGLALGVAAPSLLKELANIIGWGGASSVADALTLTEIAIRVLNFLLGTMGILALVMIVIGGILYLTSAGDEHRAEQGKEIFKFSIIGLVLAMSAMILVTQVAKFFITTPSSINNATNNTTILPTGNTPAPTNLGDVMPDVTSVLTNTPAVIDPSVINCQSAGGAADEVCTIMDPDPTRRGQYTSPEGMDCWWRNVCPTGPRMEGCCRPEVDASGL